MNYVHPVAAQRAIRREMRGQVKRTRRTFLELIAYRGDDAQRLSHLVEMYKLESGALAIMTGVPRVRIGEWLLAS